MREHDFSHRREFSRAERVKFSRPLLRFLRSAVFVKYIQEEVFTHSICTFASFPSSSSFLFRSKTVLVCTTRAEEASFCSYFQARKKPGRCFISDRISRRNLEQATGTYSLSITFPRVHLPSCPHALRLQFASSRVRLLRAVYCSLKCLRNGRSCRLPARRRGDLPQRSPSVFEPFLPRKTSPRKLHLSVVPTVESLASCSTSDISYALSASSDG